MHLEKYVCYLSKVCIYESMYVRLGSMRLVCLICTIKLAFSLLISNVPKLFCGANSVFHSL